MDVTAIRNEQNRSYLMEFVSRQEHFQCLLMNNFFFGALKNLSFSSLIVFSSSILLNIISKTYKKRMPIAL
jgi:hypothetical protein